MSRNVTVGLDGSPESLSAADWAAREARRRGLPLHVVHVGEQQPHTYEPFAAESVPAPGEDRSARMLREARASLAHRHTGLVVGTEQLDGPPDRVLAELAGPADVLVVGSRGLGRVAGHLFGSVATAVVARAQGTVVVVGEDNGADSGTGPDRDVVLGLHLPEGGADAVLEFAFDAAARRAVRLRVVHGWTTAAPGAGEEGATALEGALRPWREKFPGVEVVEEAVVGRPGTHLADASRDASLVVLGRRRRHSPMGPYLGPVTHEVLHRAVAPVAVVPHD
jgi:nucleotide-binding universal stress UspA family protein